MAAPRGGRAAAATVLFTAAGLAVEHVPLMTAIRDLARIDLSTASQPAGDGEPAATVAFGLTDRELDVLRLLGQGKTNPEIAAALFISPRTAEVHVTHILRKLDATTRVEAATTGDRGRAAFRRADASWRDLRCRGPISRRSNRPGFRVRGLV
jgi:DNA-binding CsgD family transcriptional regulator